MACKCFESTTNWAAHLGKSNVSRNLLSLYSENDTIASYLGREHSPSKKTTTYKPVIMAGPDGTAFEPNIQATIPTMSLLTEVNNGSIDDDVSRVQLYNDLEGYEKALSKLIESVDKFKPTVEVGKDLINVDKQLYSTLDSLPQYDRICGRLQELDNDAFKLDESTQKVLELLNECHDDLNSLPFLEQVEFEKKIILKQREKIKSNVLLDYATKLAKFTKIPPTFDRGSIGPNNFIWPAEDALRKGMLAMASLHVKELTHIPGQPEEDESEPQPKESVPSNDQQSEEIRQEDKKEEDSFIFGASNNNDDENGTGYDKISNDDDDEAMDSDLDLFNPEDF
ncbi:Mediator of RNA polymerase II transcription subunit 4 [Nakaseomyces bracarensis]|uniref:Mediator of RNA polymerase II transcription subunit 4 n=1 Tax=Nakaseomyces bracarensis TaxID=273131 RepID=A0ABR4NX20_9SACH